MNETEQTTFSVPSPGELEQLTELHKAMGDYTRMRILWYLMQKDSCVSELAQKMEVTESAISHQLRALRIVRLVQSRKAGKSVIYSLQDEHIRWILEETYEIQLSEVRNKTAKILNAKLLLPLSLTELHILKEYGTSDQLETCMALKLLVDRCQISNPYAAINARVAIERLSPKQYLRFFASLESLKV